MMPRPTALESVVEDASSYTDDLKASLALAKQQYRAARFIDAKDTYLACKALLESLRGPGVEFSRIAIDAQLAIISLELGKYSEAHEDFGRLLKETHRSGQIPVTSRTALLRNIMKWKSVGLLRQGRYLEAANELRSLLESASNCWIDDVKGWKMFRIDVQKNLSLAMAYLGPYSLVCRQIEQIETVKKELEPHISDTQRVRNSVGPIDASRSSGSMADGGFINDLPVQHDDLNFTAAKMHVLWGSNQEALKASTEALQGLQERLDPTHIKTLECAGLNALLLAKNCQLFEAETRCRKALHILKNRSENSRLDPSNPYVLEMTGELVEIYTLQYRMGRAMDMAVSLHKSAEQAFGRQHPLTSKSYLLLSRVQLQWGNTYDAVMGLQQLYQSSMSIYHEDHFMTLVYSSTYARALCEAGAVQEAERIAIWTLEKQRNVPSSLGRSETERDEDVRLSSDEELIHWALDATSHARKGARAHPSLLFTLETVALIEVKKEVPSWHLAEQILFRCWTQKWEDLEFGPSHPSTLASEFELAMSLQIRVEDDRQYLKKEIHLRNVYLGRMEKLGKDHAETLAAKRELIANSCSLDIWKDLPELGDSRDCKPSLQTLINEPSTPKDTSNYGGRPFDTEIWEFVGKESAEIYESHQKQLSGIHSETLKSLLWVFKLQAVNGMDLEKETCMEFLLSKLRAPQVLCQRLVESVAIRLDMAFAIIEHDLFVRALAILRQIQSDIAESSICQNSMFTDAIKRLQRTTQQYISRATRGAMPILKPELDE